MLRMNDSSEGFGSVLGSAKYSVCVQYCALTHRHPGILCHCDLSCTQCLTLNEMRQVHCWGLFATIFIEIS